ncbi:LysR family transcriptional regulator [uncultured Litoreibacter sp.]|uniref:LysR family transcriptional regulator n=1 Tax=uncultured Litoreibacter sp. TaxID=1392394 RepID=UPI002612D8D0|nr:LysR family transcriptional regulator [uncultured Litoreibacter sp.]
MNEKGWDDLQLFLAVAREGGLSPAARVTGRSPATLGRRMLALERSLGRELFNRHDRGYALTADARALLAELTGVEAQISRATATSDGPDLPLVKISAGSWTTLALMPRIAEIAGDPADTRLRFVMNEAQLDIAHREVVIGIRNSRPTEPGLAGRKLARVDFVPYAAKGAPDRWIKVVADTPSARWLDKSVGTDAICEVTAPRNSLDLALQGVGMALLPTFVGDALPRLQRRGDPVAELSHDRWLATHDDDRHLPHVRRVIDRLCDLLLPRNGLDRAEPGN